MVKYFLFSMCLAVGVISCGVKKAPTPLYSIPDSALNTKKEPTPSPTP